LSLTGAEFALNATVVNQLAQARIDENVGTLGAARASYFACDPGTWSQACSTGQQNFYCTRTIVLTEPSVVMASVTGHAKVASGWHYVFIEFDDDVPNATDFCCTPPPFAPSHSYSTQWENSTTTRVVELAAGVHTVRYGQICNAAGAGLNGSSLQGAIIPKSLGATAFQCTPSTWTRASGVGAAVVGCETTVSPSQPSYLFAAATGHWQVNQAFSFGWIQVNGQPTSAVQTAGSVYTESTLWESFSTMFIGDIPSGPSTVRYLASPTTNTTVTMNGSSMTGFWIPRTAFMERGTLTPAASVQFPVGSSAAVLASGRMHLPGPALVLAAFNGHWFNNTSTWMYAWVRADGIGTTAPVEYLSPAHSYTGNWESTSHLRVLPLTGGYHTLELMGYANSGTTTLNGSSVRWLALPN
jgi:hypothetical protein